MKIILFKVYILLNLFNTYESITFHSGGMVQSNTLVPDLIDLISNLNFDNFMRLPYSVIS